jgi:acyl-CoA synthetase (NDP forming)
MADAIHDCLPESDKPVLAYVSPHAPQVAAVLNQRGVPAFSAPESCAVAFGAMLAAARPVPTVVAAPLSRDVDTSDVAPGSLDEAAAKALFARFGVPGVREAVVADAAQAAAAAHDLGDRVVLKMLSSTVTHKSDVGGVAVNVAPGDIAMRLDAMRNDVLRHTGSAPERYLVQEMVSGGVEMILGMHRDALGTAILLGMGGVTAELFQDTTMRLLPPSGGLTRDEALSMIRELKTWPLLDGYRGRPKGDVTALADAIVAFSSMTAALGPRLIEAEINPLFVLPAGQGVRAADGVAVIGT